MSRSAPGAVRRLALDPRLLVGLALVAASVAGVVGIVAAADDTVDVLVADRPLVPGDRLDRGDAGIRSVNLDTAQDLYLATVDVPEAGLVVTRPVSAGELIPASAVDDAARVRTTSVVIEVSDALAESVQPTASVDIWAAQRLDGDTVAPPVAIVTGATVVRLVESDSIVSGGQTTAIEVLVPTSKVARVLQAVNGDDALSIVPSTPGR